MTRVSLAVAACLVIAAVAAFAAGPSQMSVQVEQAKVRATPSALGKIVGTLAYGDLVTVLDQPAGAPESWREISVESKGITGWVSLSALTDKPIKLQAGSQNAQTGASSGEVALAGKGFNEDVEKEYKSEGNVDYKWVDRMETYNPTDDQVLSFLQTGGLNATGGPQ